MGVRVPRTSSRSQMALVFPCLVQPFLSPLPFFSTGVSIFLHWERKRVGGRLGSPLGTAAALSLSLSPSSHRTSRWLSPSHEGGRGDATAPSLRSFSCRLEGDGHPTWERVRGRGRGRQRRSQTTCAGVVRITAMAGRTWMAVLMGTVAWMGARGDPYDEPGPCRYRREKMDVETTTWCVERTNETKTNETSNRRYLQKAKKETKS